MTAPKPKKTAKTAPQGARGVGKRTTDWEAVERDYRTGKYTNRELETAHNVSFSMIARKARDNAWEKDLAVAIKQATRAKLIDDLVNKEVHKGTHKVHNTVEVAATMGMNVILGHRKGLLRLTDVKAKLLSQIEQAAESMADLAKIIEMVRKPDDNGMDRANDALKKAMSRSALVDDLKKLADVDEKVRKGEREAFSVDEDRDDEPGTATANAIRSLLATIGRSAFPVSA